MASEERFGRKPLTNADLKRLGSRKTKIDRPEKVPSAGQQQAQAENAQLRQMIEGGAPADIVHQATNDLIASRLNRTVTPMDWAHKKGLTISHLLTPDQFAQHQETGTWEGAPTAKDYRVKGYIHKDDPGYGKIGY